MFKNAVGMNNPAISGPTYPLVAGIFQGMGVSRGQQYFKALKRNGLKIFPTNGNTLQALLDGSIKVAMFQDSAERHDAAERHRDQRQGAGHDGRQGVRQLRPQRQEP